MAMMLDLSLTLTFDEITNLRLDMSFLQVLYHSVGDSSQMTHVTSPGPTLSSRDIRGHKTNSKRKSIYAILHILN